MRKLAAIIIGLAFGLCAVQAMARNGRYLFREMARYQVPSGAAPALTASLLLHFDEANGSTTTTDSGKHGLTVTAQAGAFITNSPSKFGNNAALDGQTGRRFDVAWTNDFAPGTNDWSVDFWVNCSAAKVDTNSDFWCVGAPTNNARLSFVSLQKQQGLNPATLWRLTVSTNGAASAVTTWAYDPLSLSNKWLHVAFYRYTNTLHFFTNGVDGVLGNGSRSVQGANFLPILNEPYRIGGRGVTVARTGPSNIDEVRICIGSAMPYTGTNFTPPTAPYTGYE